MSTFSITASFRLKTILRLPIILLVAAALMAGGCSRREMAPELLELTMLDIGQCECLILRTSKATCLIDTGCPVTAPAVKRALSKRGIKRVDLVILTHQHEDHIGGLAQIAESFPISQILESVYPEEGVPVEQTNKWRTRYGIQGKRARAGQKVLLEGGVQLDILWPRERLYQGTRSDINNSSVVAMVRHGQIRMLLMGDAEKEVEAALLGDNIDLKADLLKVGHQGSRESSGIEFLWKVRPKLALISAGSGNEYGHPHQETLDRLKMTGTTVYLTGRDGEINIISDGRTIRRH